MFVNQVNIKDLFSTNPSLIGRRDQASDSAFDSSQGNSNSQFMFSQVDFSESQDFMSGPSQTPAETRNSPGKKFYQRYMSKALLFPKDSQSADNTKTKLSFKEQLAANKAAAKERDDREIISSIFNVIKESTYELKEAINVVQDDLKEGSCSRNELKDHIAKVEENLSKQTVKFLDDLTTRDQLKDEICQLKRQLTQKETEGIKIKEQLKEAKANQLKILKDQLHKMHEEHKVWLSQHMSDLASKQKDLFEKVHDKQQKFSEQHSKTVKKIETTLQKHADNCMKQQKSDYNKYQQWFNDLKESHGHHTSTVQEALTKDLKDLMQNQSKGMGTLIRQQDQLRTLYQQHRTDMEKYLREQLQVTKDGNSEIRELVDHICRETLPAIVHQEVRKDNYVETQKTSKSPTRDFSESSAYPCETTDEYPRTRKVDIKFTERTTNPKGGFCSPLTPFVKTWDTKMLFSKRNLGQGDVAATEPDVDVRETRLQKSCGPVQNRYRGTQAPGVKRTQEAMDTSSSSFDNTTFIRRPGPGAGKSSPVKRNLRQQKTQSSRMASPPGVLTIKPEPATPDARWLQALSAKAKTGVVGPEQNMEQAQHLEIQDVASQFSSPSLSVSEFFFPRRKEDTSSSTVKSPVVRRTKRRKKSSCASRKRSVKK